MKIKLILACVIGLTPILGAEVAQESKDSSTEFSLDQLIVQARAIEFDKNSAEVECNYHFYNGQNVQNARDVNFVLGFSAGLCSIETLYGLYLALKEFRSPEGEGFLPEDLNDGFTHDNFQFFKKIFEESE